MNTVREIQRLNDEELRRGIRDEQSWHMSHRNNAWVFAGGLDVELSEGDVVCVFSQFGEVEDAHLVRDEATGRSKGFAFVKFEDWRSTVLAVDNMNGAPLMGRTLRVDHTDKRPPREPKGGEEEAGPGSGPAAARPAQATYRDYQLKQQQQQEQRDEEEEDAARRRDPRALHAASSAAAAASAAASAAAAAASAMAAAAAARVAAPSAPHSLPGSAAGPRPDGSYPASALGGAMVAARPGGGGRGGGAAAAPLGWKGARGAK